VAVWLALGVSLAVAALLLAALAPAGARTAGLPPASWLAALAAAAAFVCARRTI
jgi:hypothetical protein